MSGAPGTPGPSEQMLIPHDQAFHLPAEYAQVAADLGYGHLLYPCPEGSHEFDEAVAAEAERRFLGDPGDLDDWKPTGLLNTLGVEPGGGLMEVFPGFEPVELAGEWPRDAPAGVFHASGDREALVIEQADPRLVISAELVDQIVGSPHPNVFVELTGRDYVGALLKIRGVNRNVVYRLAGWYPSIRAYLGEFT